MTECLIDTDILSYYFKGDPEVVQQFRNYLQEYDQVNVSIVTYFEILSGLKFKMANKQILEFESFVSNNTVIHITEFSAEISSNIYARLRQNGISIGTSDLLIAGIAIENDLTLVTNNEKHFSVIEGLRVTNWKSK